MPSKMAGLHRLVPPVVVPSVGVADGCRNQIGWRRVVKAGQLDRDEIPSELLKMASAERMHAAVPAKDMMPDELPELVVRKHVCASEQPEGLWPDEGIPAADLGAEAAVAATGASGEVDVGREPHRAAVTTAVEGLDAHDRFVPVSLS